MFSWEFWPIGKSFCLQISKYKRPILFFLYIHHSIRNIFHLGNRKPVYNSTSGAEIKSIISQNINFLQLNFNALYKKIIWNAEKKIIIKNKLLNMLDTIVIHRFYHIKVAAFAWFSNVYSQATSGFILFVFDVHPTRSIVLLFSRKAAKALLVLIPLLGVTYIVVIVTPTHRTARVIFSYAQALLLSTQVCAWHYWYTLVCMYFVIRINSNLTFFLLSRVSL